mmetsp:Transcript_52930/g.72277  ORF Transcript_52930/g.72277 Transcript_52930/m.72277 type:complete len:97 (+) Transcript_52930:57-347(+)
MMTYDGLGREGLYLPPREKHDFKKRIGANWTNRTRLLWALGVLEWTLPPPSSSSKPKRQRNVTSICVPHHISRQQAYHSDNNAWLTTHIALLSPQV